MLITSMKLYFILLKIKLNLITNMVIYIKNLQIILLKTFNKNKTKEVMLMSYVKINTYFYGHKHISSGLYIITKQEDSIDASGYRSTLSITRVSGDEMG